MMSDAATAEAQSATAEPAARLMLRMVVSLGALPGCHPQIQDVQTEWQLQGRTRSKIRHSMDCSALCPKESDGISQSSFLKRII
mmetsp:Transcript_4813/g.12625  ORF Transcript_4813/g.12625 Transcript_4813/m.12625 type:complete len:84 (-) Transcript_4813:45-296(-)